MHNLSHHFHHHYKTAHGFIIKHKHHAHHFVFAGVAIVLGIFLYNKFVLAGTSGFVQSSWSGGVDTLAVADASHQSTWNKYYSAVGVNANSTVSLSLSDKMMLDDGGSKPSLFGTIQAPQGIMGMSVSSDGKNVYIATQIGYVIQGNIDQNTGAITPMNPPTLPAGMAYTVTVSPDGKNVYIPSAQDGKVYQYSRDLNTGALTFISDVQAGAAAIQVAISANGLSAYVTDNTNGFLYQFDRNISTGELTPMNVPFIAVGTSPASFGVVISPDDKSVYVAATDANQGNSFIYQYSRNQATGELSPMATDAIPSSPSYGMSISPDGKNLYAANLESSTISQYARDLNTGELSLMSNPTLPTSSAPFTPIISPDGSKIYLSHVYGDVVEYNRNKTTGELTVVDSFSSGFYTYGAALSPNNKYFYSSEMASGNINTYKIGSGDPNIILSSGFSAGVNSSTVVSGTGVGTSVSLTQKGNLNLISPSLVQGVPEGRIFTSPDNKSIYVVNNNNNNNQPSIHQYGRDINTGSIYELSPSSIALSSSYNQDDLLFSSDGSFAYVVAGSSIYIYSRDLNTGVLTEISNISLETYSAEFVISPDDTSIYVYVSNWNGGTSSYDYHIDRYDRDISTGALVVGSSIPINLTQNENLKEMKISPDGSSIYISTSKYDQNNNMRTGYIHKYDRNITTGEITDPDVVYQMTGADQGEFVISHDGKSIYFLGQETNTSGAFILQHYERNLSTGELSALSSLNLSGQYFVSINISNDDSSIYILDVYGNNILQYKRNLSTGDLSVMPSLEGRNTSFPEVLAFSPDNLFAYLMSSDSGNNGNISLFSRATVSASSGTFTSAPIDLGNGIFTTLSWTETLNGQTITMKARSSATSDFSGSPDWSTCSNINNGDALSTGGCVTSGNRYIQYQATLSTNDVNVSPSLDSVAVGFTQYGDSNGEGELISSVYDSGSDSNLIVNMRWEDSNTSQTETVKFQVRSASTTAGLATSPWCGSGLVCDGNSYFTDNLGSVVLDSNHPLRTGNNDRYFQYRMLLTSAGSATPSVSSVTVEYVANSAPEFDQTYGTNGVLISQAGATSSNPGVVSISYKVRDTDTSEGTISPGYIKPSFQYNAGSGWVTIDPSALAVGDTDNKAVEANNYTTYTATWSASTTIEGLFSSNVQIRVIADDNEAANGQGVVDSSSFTLDTKAPLVTATFDSSVSSPENIILTASDNNQFRYRLCNDPLFPATDAQNNSCAWTGFSGDINQVSIPWTPTGSPNNEVIYLEVGDVYGNVNAKSIIAPATPTDIVYADLSQPINNHFVEFVSWSMFQNVPSSTFASYKLYNSTDGENFTLLTDIADINLNYYRHEISVASSSLTQYYKIVATNTEGNISNFSQVVSDIPDGSSQASSDNTPAEISDIAVPSQFIKSSQAKVTFNTNKLSKAIVHYHVSGNQGWYTASSTSYLPTGHSVNLSGLLPNTTYDIEVATMNINGIVSAFVSGPSFTTNSGPVISNVVSTAISANSATIQWNTSTSSDSYVYYSSNQAFTNPLFTGSATKVTCAQNGICAHSVIIPSLTTGHTYYYYVKSTDSAGDTMIDDHNSNYYYFVTTVDTVAPIISSISTPVVSSASAVAIWKTNEPATSQIKWGTTSGNLDHTTVLDNTKSVYHVVTLSKDTYDTNSLAQTLTPSTSYFYRVFSSDAAGNEASSTEQTFTTTATGKVTVVNQYVSSGGGGYSASPTVVASKNTNTTVKDKIPPVIFNIRPSDIGVFNADIKVTTNEDVSVFVSYGETKSYESTEGDPNWSTDKTIHLKKLQAGTTYHYAVKVSDRAGNQTVSEDKTFTTLPVSQITTSAGNSFFANDANIQKKLEKIIESALPSLSPPFVSTPTVSKDKITEDSAVVTWETNIKSAGLIKYSTDDMYTATSTYSLESPTDEEKKTKHTVVLTGLKPNTKYHLQANSYVFPQVIGKSKDVTFTTSAAKIRATIVDRNKEGFTVAWTTDEPTSSFVEYTNVKTGISRTITDDNKKLYHSVKVANLTPDTRFKVSVSGINNIGNTVEAAETITAFTSSDLIPPTISNFKIDNALVPGKNDSIQTVIGWQTSEIANSTVYYEEGTGSSDSKDGKLANKVETPDDYTLNHTMILANLKPGTVYRISVVSSDPSGNTKTFGPNTVITPKQAESVLDLIFKNFEDTFKFLRTTGQ